MTRVRKVSSKQRAEVSNRVEVAQQGAPGPYDTCTGRGGQSHAELSPDLFPHSHTSGLYTTYNHSLGCKELEDSVVSYSAFKKWDRQEMPVNVRK